MRKDDAVRAIEHEIASQLRDIRAWEAEGLATEHPLNVGFETAPAPQTGGRCPLESEGRIRSARWVEEQRERHALAVCEDGGALGGLERDHQDLRPEIGERRFMVPQLREVLPAGDSPKPSQEHQNQRAPLPLVKLYLLAALGEEPGVWGSVTDHQSCRS
jgi:hypothetical protein